MLPREILQKYWGYGAFRPLQEEIIHSVLEGKDTLALLPTGGGKSVCFQVPALARDGMCLVISPLIALMKDQVRNLHEKGIPAFALYSGMHPRESELVYNNCASGRARFLYVSPERLESREFLTRIQHWKINLLAVDEAHCISQWGYDFRPPYLKIAAVRRLLPGVPVLALTATATPPVVDDIQEKLEFSEKNVFQKSFLRSNLAYLVLHEEDKRGRLLRIISKTPGTGIIYVRNRKKTAETAQFLNRHQVAASFYHAGLDHASRATRQDDWIKGKTRVMVATNAFGMGIDKPDVRFVVHLDLPDSLEAYFQEAGRAGRDEKSSYSVILYDQTDLITLETNVRQSVPEPDTIRKVYSALGNYGRIPLYGGIDAPFPFDIGDFCRQYRFQPLIVYRSIEFLEREGYLLRSSDFGSPSRLHFLAGREDLYRIQVQYPELDEFIRVMLRSYGGLFSDYAVVNEAETAKRCGISPDQAVIRLKRLMALGVLDYQPRKTMPELTFCRERVDEKYLPLAGGNYQQLCDRAVEKYQAVLHYVTSVNRCRSRLLLEYFGEANSSACGRCDVCLQRHRSGITDAEFGKISDILNTMLQQEHLSMEQVRDRITGQREEAVVIAMNWLIDQGSIKTDRHGKLYWRS
ncbi:MAG TPA: RecQ family ATP-dependent DNA helicase [Bacteroidales bacterium]|nr:RecQ family ATP-dependent DNA helicase [Bacteroidales bacterium]HSA44055.1 RecQ family ATP-dependent DNA helicase [Bacteroidales bacterium]